MYVSVVVTVSSKKPLFAKQPHGCLCSLHQWLDKAQLFYSVLMQMNPLFGDRNLVAESGSKRRPAGRWVTV